MKKIIIGLPIVLIIIGIISWTYIQSTPQYSLYQMYQAVRAHDYNTFIKYADTDSIANNVIDKVVEDSKQKQSKSGNEWEELGQNMAQGMIIAMKPSLIQQMKSSIRKGVEEGDLKGADYTSGNVIAALTKMKVQREGKVADVTAFDDNNKPLKFKMRQMDGYWQVFDMNLDTDSDTASDNNDQSAASTTKSKFGERIDLGSGWFLSVSSPSAYLASDVYSGPEEGKKFVSVEVTYENTSAEPGTYSTDNLKIKDANDHVYSPEYSGKEPLLSSGTLEAKGKVNGFLTFEIPEPEQVKSVTYSNFSGKSVVIE